MHLEWHPMWLLRPGMATRWTAPPRVSPTLSEISFEVAPQCEWAVRNIFRRITGAALGTQPEPEPERARKARHGAGPGWRTQQTQFDF
jgi:hypothetical protein